ncbi:MAG TPA: CsgG/HfaB family protein [Arenimonas sp.]|uniref:CsgG/HfaB family protein n=1 Tax=Arenimonas sp. TaxID=1872635 RepID=UPI002C62A75F|nr:CsgG/HfaB family protein [Arenimonas sp.]HMB56630.1 CsgG/HfaB family protein [Arenimonas sp.]
MKSRFLIANLFLAAALFPFAAFAKEPAGKPTIAVAEFKNESNAGWWGSSVGRDLAGMLSNELSNTGSFRVVERQKVQAVLEEQNLMASGRAKLSDAAQMGKLAGAQYLVMGTVTSYEEDTKHNSSGLSFGGVSLGGNSQTAYIAIDIRVVDTTTGDIAYSRTIEGTSKGGGMKLGFNKFGVGGDLANQENKPAGKAIRAAVVLISDYLDCVMVEQDSCRSKFDAQEQRRREHTSNSIKLD